MKADFKGRPRLRNEAGTVRTMISMYCRENHGPGGLCDGCRELTEYAMERLDRCPFGEGKTVCSVCEVHCYKPEMRRRIRDAMRFAGPRMISRHPLLAINHLLHKRRKKPISRS
ncbi:Nitrous oxide-stimulated promoter [Dehalogenimonas formicexedens]|uniref:Nitrous oxide-stimulated promoter n=1 Tax=Dehalogenimonas formicexedens TaxID=1839801 RepID=A0A1P8F5Z1_9CHLR|nr:nitrous oxide-stimulated promoter family protein [Dehalogenimonas formicexedens]APV43899.1 Nitrous oxide-stimulated promoter [Dehalogenimonas formicexedens]